jgi:hypothetical protein
MVEDEMKKEEDKKSGQEKMRNITEENKKKPTSHKNQFL